MITYIAYRGNICFGLVYGEAHAETLRQAGYRLELYAAPRCEGCGQ